VQDAGKFLVMAGLIAIVVGAWLWSGRGAGWIGHLPGDLSGGRDGFRFYFPITTCLLLSVVISLLAWLFRR
jgi:hypothetical protein